MTSETMTISALDWWAAQGVHTDAVSHGDHVHSWRFATLLDVPPYGRGYSDTPTTALFTCMCGALLRRAIPQDVDL